MNKKKGRGESNKEENKEGISQSNYLKGAQQRISSIFNIQSENKKGPKTLTTEEEQKEMIRRKKLIKGKETGPRRTLSESEATKREGKRTEETKGKYVRVRDQKEKESGKEEEEKQEIKEVIGKMYEKQKEELDAFRRSFKVHTSPEKRKGKEETEKDVEEMEEEEDEDKNKEGRESGLEKITKMLEKITKGQEEFKEEINGWKGKMVVLNRRLDEELQKIRQENEEKWEKQKIEKKEVKEKEEEAKRKKEKEITESIQKLKKDDKEIDR